MANNGPLVSIILPVYEGEAFLRGALRSVEEQDYRPIELIAVDDGSTDDSLSVLRDFAARFDRPVHVLQHPDGAHLGIAATYRLALGTSRGSLLAFLDQDDLWSNDKISAQVAAIGSNLEIGVVFSDVYTVADGGPPSSKPFRGLLNRPPRDRAFCGFSRLLWGNYALTFSSILVRKNLVTTDDFVDEPEGYQDWIFLLLLSKRCLFLHCSTGKTFWRLHKGSFHGRHRRKAGHLAVDGQQRKVVMSTVRRALAEGVGLRGVTSGWRLAWSQKYWTGVATLLHYAYLLVSVFRRALQLGSSKTASVAGTTSQTGAAGR